MHVLLAALLVTLFSGCATKDRDHVLLVSVPDQKMLLLERGIPVVTYRVSTSKFGAGAADGSYFTPLGVHEVAAKIGDGAPEGAVFKDRRPTGEVLRPNAPGRDPIVTRILWLRGTEPGNQNSFQRYIYIHGTPEERSIGKPASYGCIRMRSRDVVQLYEIVGRGARVEILSTPLPTTF